MSELLESEVWGPGSHVRRYSIFSKFDDTKRVEKTRSEKKLRKISAERFSRGRNEGVPPTHVAWRRAQEVLSGWNNQTKRRNSRFDERAHWRTEDCQLPVCSGYFLDGFTRRPYVSLLATAACWTAQPTASR